MFEYVLRQQLIAVRCKDTAFVSKSQIADGELTFIVGDLTFIDGELTFIDGELTLAPGKNEGRLRQSTRKVTARTKEGYGKNEVVFVKP